MLRAGSRSVRSSNARANARARAYAIDLAAFILGSCFTQPYTFICAVYLVRVGMHDNLQPVLHQSGGLWRTFTSGLYSALQWTT